MKLNSSKLVTTFLSVILLSSCQNKQNNFDIDLSEFKIPRKSVNKISNTENLGSSSVENKIIQNKLITYKKKSDVLSSVKIGKKDPFSKGEIKVNKLNSDFKLTGFINTKIKKFALVNYLDNEGTITEGNVGGQNTNLLPNGAKVISINPKNNKLIIFYENKSHTFKL